MARRLGDRGMGTLAHGHGIEAGEVANYVEVAVRLREPIAGAIGDPPAINSVAYIGSSALCILDRLQEHGAPKRLFLDNHGCTAARSRRCLWLL